uniref:Receptor L-domain domain-containing protein n=1 Tax=Chromera velia CCMP2878 TaxID=1169474 RepID=A0A0G4FD46_9ALVE|eukprot:Cvel_3183.t1-p1 / transcript=Cvel_3183.t1 / gene=Cvel_3183 / organism=Chromera_velia_CCMP2878 / gene_product=hypothetical protein / transcript_product=hypothetical protein / location=Cvel_scaffold124:39570-43292(+) / protein_length=520 / sequence_SO=supercontig / SO=protein_coding / is_pseudo=false
MRGLSCSLIAFFLLVSPAVGKLDLADFGEKLADTFKGGVPELAKLDLSELFSDKLETKEDILKDRKDILKKSKDACEIPVYNPKEFAKCPPPTPPCTAENTLTVEALLTRLGLPPQNAFRSCDPARLKDAFQGVCRFEGSIILNDAQTPERGFDSPQGCVSLNDADLVEAFSSLRELTGGLQVFSDLIRNVKTFEGFSGLVSVEGQILINSRTLESLVPPAFCNLESVSVLRITQNAFNLKKVAMPSLKSVRASGGLEIEASGDTGIEFVWFPNLVNVEGDVSLDGPGPLGSFFAPALERVAGSFSVDAEIDGLECLNLPGLRFAGRFGYNYPFGKALLLPNLKSVETVFSLQEVTSLERFELSDRFDVSAQTDVVIVVRDWPSSKDQTKSVRHLTRTLTVGSPLFFNVLGISTLDLSSLVQISTEECDERLRIARMPDLETIIWNPALKDNFAAWIEIFDIPKLDTLDGLGDGLTTDPNCNSGGLYAGDGLHAYFDPETRETVYLSVAKNGKAVLPRPA